MQLPDIEASREEEQVHGLQIRELASGRPIRLFSFLPSPQILKPAEKKAKFMGFGGQRPATPPRPGAPQPPPPPGVQR